jgi:hypothetical protein
MSEEEVYHIKLAFNPRTAQYDLCECDKCGAYVLPQSYPRHIKTQKHLNAKQPLSPKKADDVSPVGKTVPFKVERGNFKVGF